MDLLFFGEFVHIFIIKEYLAKLILADTSFFIYKNEENDHNLSIISKYLFILDISTVFTLQTTLVLIPLNWY